ncbi:MAG TPA: hypothetical protein VKF36_03470 [Syntrophorhabdales bacterium]|nr:hypothetical protein [Syntrophorhabdales bacterium]
MKTAPKKKVFITIIGLVVMVMLAGCASTGDKAEKSAPPPTPSASATSAPPQAPPLTPGAVTGTSKPSPDTQYFIHTVKFKGESVSIIAGWYTGDIQNWKVLKEHNPDINPNRIFDGNKIRIPQSMMKTKAPMPKEYVDSFYSKPTRKEPVRPAPAPSPSTSGGDEPTLFGPK